MIDDTRLVFYPTSNYIKDRLTGETFFTNNRRICHQLNKLNDKADKNAEQYTNLIHLIQETYETERTQIGKNVLKQLLEAIQ